jgi:flagellar protein FliT
MHDEQTTDILTSYEHLARVTSLMREAAIRDDWDSVIALESECAGLYTRLMEAKDAAPSDVAQQRRKSELICKVLEDDARIRELLSGQLVNIWRLLEGERQVVRLTSAYGGAASGASQSDGVN